MSFTLKTIYIITFSLVTTISLLFKDLLKSLADQYFPMNNMALLAMIVILLALLVYMWHILPESMFVDSHSKKLTQIKMNQPTQIT